jgi:GNAT superfamily N-acetyltransferase
MNQDFSIQQARLRDVPTLPEIERAAGKLFAGLVPASLLDYVTDEAELLAGLLAGRLWVALCRDEPVGFALVNLLSDGLPHLEEVDVLPDHARQGIGAALIAAACDWATQAGHPSITLTTFRDIPWNMPYYSRLGWEVIEPADLSRELRALVREEAAHGLDPLTRVVMRRRLAR